jgi:5-methylcytosine-specific restriction protein A
VGKQYPSVPPYSSPEWQALRAEHKRLHPNCAMCLEMGIVRKGRNVDHKIPHRGNYQLWRDPNNLQTLCDPHDRSTKQRQELRGEAPGCNLSGWPDDPNHYWNTGKPQTQKVTNQQKIGETKKGKQ